MNELTFQYPPSALPFIAGKRYAWNVQALRGLSWGDVSPELKQQNNGISEISSFKFAEYEEVAFTFTKVEFFQDGKLIASTTTDKNGKFTVRNLSDGLYKVKISMLKGNLPKTGTITINNISHIICCCPGPPCEDPLELFIGESPAAVKGTALFLRRADQYSGAIKQNPGGYSTVGDANSALGSVSTTRMTVVARNTKPGTHQVSVADIGTIPLQRRIEDGNTAMGSVSTTRMVVASGQATPGRAITGIDITLPNNPDANTVRGLTGQPWNGMTSTFVITATSRPVNGRIDPRIEESRILLSIKKDGKKVCGAYTSSTAPFAGLTKAKMIGQLSTSPSTGIADLLGEACILKVGLYQLSAQFFDNNYRKITPLSDEMITSFTIKAGTDATDVPARQKQIDIEKGAIKQNPGGYLTTVDNNNRPAANIIHYELEVKQGDNGPVFHWKVNNPAPGQSYSIKIVEIIGEQSVEDAVETNIPVFEEKGIKKTSFEYPAHALKKGYLDKPPTGSLNSKYACVVTAWDKNGKQAGQRQIILGVNLSF